MPGTCRQELGKLIFFRGSSRETEPPAREELGKKAGNALPGFFRGRIEWCYFIHSPPGKIPHRIREIRGKIVAAPGKFRGTSGEARRAAQRPLQLALKIKSPLRFLQIGNSAILPGNAGKLPGKQPELPSSSGEAAPFFRVRNRECQDCPVIDRGTARQEWGKNLGKPRSSRENPGKIPGNRGRPRGSMPTLE